MKAEFAEQVEELRRRPRFAEQANKIIDSLVKAGCNENEIISSLFAYCGGDPKVAGSEKRDIRFRRRRMIALSKELTAVADEIKIASTYLEDVQLSCHFTPDVAGLKAYAALLSKAANTAYKRFASGRNTGRDHHLIYLYRLIEKLTGRPHYSELATLITATRLVYEPNSKIIGAKAVQERIKRHKHNYKFSNFEE